MSVSAFSLVLLLNCLITFFFNFEIIMSIDSNVGVLIATHCTFWHAYCQMPFVIFSFCKFNHVSCFTSELIFETES